MYCPESVDPKRALPNSGELMNVQQIENIRASFAALAPQAQTLVDRFYQNLFLAHPEVRGLFPKDISEQKQHLLAALSLVVKNVDRLETLQAPLREMGTRHVGYGAEPEHYPVVRDILLQTMKEMAGKLWNDTLRADWTVAVNAVAQVMLDGAARMKAQAA
jgi:hemoglobin-like flavoprotein